MTTDEKRIKMERWTRLGDAYRKKERGIKVEIAIVSFLWLVGCPLLALGLPNSGSDYGKPFDQMCDLYAYSVSASMTGQYPKLLGTIMAPNFALLVVQRSSGSLCGILKLGWIVRYSQLIPNRKPISKEKDDNRDTITIALHLWNYIERIEYLGYLAAFFLVGLVAFDAQNFLITHDILASLAFFCLCYQNYLVGVALPTTFPEVFPKWQSDHAANVFWWAKIHLAIMMFLMYFLGTMDHFNQCDTITEIMESISLQIFGNPFTVRWIASVFMWYNEYAFAFMSVYVQLLEHYELRLWDFVGETSMPYAAVLSRFSLRGAIGAMFGRGLFFKDDASFLLGIPEKAKSI